MILSLFDYTGNMVKPWLDDHDCMIVDTQHILVVNEGRLWKRPYKITTVEDLIRDLTPTREISMIFSAAPCTDLAGSGARWFKAKAEKNPSFQVEAVALCRIAEELGSYYGCPWMNENPSGVLSTMWRKPDHWFHPCEYTGYCADDNYTKKTGIHCGNGFVMPEKNMLPEIQEAINIVGRIQSKSTVLKKSMNIPTRAYLEQWYPDDRIHKAAPGPDRANIRSATPMGFSIAVHKANRENNQ